MYAHALKLVGNTATLLEWDDRIPSFEEVHELGYAVDDFFIAVKKRQSNVLRGRLPLCRSQLFRADFLAGQHKQPRWETSRGLGPKIRKLVMSELLASKGARAAAGCPELGNKTGGEFLS
jgi:hypothetical protein